MRSYFQSKCRNHVRRDQQKSFFLTSTITDEDGKLTVDDNHPFAGNTITCNITVVEVRDTTADEHKTASKT